MPVSATLCIPYADVCPRKGEILLVPALEVYPLMYVQFLVLHSFRFLEFFVLAIASYDDTLAIFPLQVYSSCSMIMLITTDVRIIIFC